METSFNLKDRLKEAKKEMVMDGEDSLQFEGWGWTNTKAMSRIQDIYDIYDIEPNCVDTTKGGVAIYRNVPGRNGGKWYRWRIEDNWFLHEKPATHADFFFLEQPIYVPAEKVLNLSKISDSISYYPLGNIASAGCHFRGAAVATLSIIKEYAQGYLTLEQAMDTYDRRISELAKEFMVARGKPGTTPITDIYEEYILL